MNRFQEVTNSLEQALDGIYYEKLDIYDEVKEQVGLVCQTFCCHLNCCDYIVAEQYAFS